MPASFAPCCMPARFGLTNNNMKHKLEMNWEGVSAKTRKHWKHKSLKTYVHLEKKTWKLKIVKKH